MSSGIESGHNVYLSFTIWYPKEGIINQITGTKATEKHVQWLWRRVMWLVQSFHKYVKAATILERWHWWQQVHAWGVRKNCLRRFKLQRWRFSKVRRRLGRWYRSSPKKKKRWLTWPHSTHAHFILTQDAPQFLHPLLLWSLNSQQKRAV